MSVVKETENFTSDEDQPDLFQKFGATPDYLSANAPFLDIEQEFLGAITACIRAARDKGLSRDRIVERMNLCLADPENPTPIVTKRQLNGWTATSQEYRLFPAIYLPAFIWACTGNLQPLNVLSGPLGLVVVNRREQDAMELGRIAMAKAKNSKDERLIKQRLGM